MISYDAPIDLVIFDFDGTLVDTAPDLIRATNLYLESQGFEPLPEDKIRNEIGMGLRKLITEVYPSQDGNVELHRQIETDFLAVYEREFLTSPQLYPGAMEFLTEWDQQVAIVSNKRRRFIDPILKKLGLADLPWAAIVGGDTYPNMKPHPEPFLAAIAAAGASPESTVIVGDGYPDVQGAVALGSRCVAVEFGYTDADNLIEQGAWKKIANFHELLPLLR